MQWIEYLDLASSVARLAGFVASPFFLGVSVHSWFKGDKEKAIYLLCFCILLSLPR